MSYKQQLFGSNEPLLGYQLYRPDSTPDLDSPQVLDSIHLKRTITVPELTLGDWLKISEAKDNSPQWGFHAWLDNSNQDLEKLNLVINIVKLTLGDWLDISKAKDNSPLWGFYGWWENSDTDWGELTRRDVEAIAKAIEKPMSFIWRELEGR